MVCVHEHVHVSYESYTHCFVTYHGFSLFTSTELEEYQGCFYEGGSEEACLKEAEVSSSVIHEMICDIARLSNTCAFIYTT